jgi:HK97 family phage portal protein
VSVWFRSPGGPRGDGEQSTRSHFPAGPFRIMASAIAGTFDEGVPQTFEGSMQVIAVRSAVDLLASLATELPFGVYSGTEAARRKWQTPSNLLDPAGDGHGVEDWGYQLITSWLLRGNTYGDVLAGDPGGRLDQVSIFHPDRVGGYEDPQTGEVTWTVNGMESADQVRMLHLRVNPVPGVVLGLSPVQVHATELGLAVSSLRFGQQWFADGAHPSGLLSNTEDNINKEQAETAKKRFLAALRGRREPLVLGKGWKWDSIQVNPNESQFLETRGYSAAECCRIFGPAIAETLGYETKQKMTYSNRVDRAQDFLTLSLDRWLRRYERVLSRFLPVSRYVHIERDQLLIMNLLERYRSYEIAAKIGLRTLNDMRGKEHLGPVAWGEQPFPFVGSKGSGNGSSGGDSDDED